MRFAVALSLFALIWCVAVLLKLAVMRARRRPYRFTQWDGGSMLRDRVLGRGGTLGLLVFALACGGFATYQLVRWMRLS